MNELRRPIQNRMLAGVCACLANRMGIDPSIFRIAYVLLSLFTVGFPGILLYIIMWIIIPDERHSDNNNNKLNR